MTRLEWEKESQQFQNALTPELRALLPEVQNRQKPLAKIDFAQPIAEQLNSRFQKSQEEVTSKVVSFCFIRFIDLNSMFSREPERITIVGRRYE